MIKGVAGGQDDEPWLGIDLGMSSTCAGVWTADGKVEILPWGASGLKAVPSVVSFLPANKVAIGAGALAS